jgi:ribosomal protein S18 acetylase RimI-like enzyme
MLYTSKKMSVSLGDGYRIQALEMENDTLVELWSEHSQVGMARLLTDLVDVCCVTAIHLDEDHSAVRLPNHTLLSNAFIDSLIKLPNMVKQPEFTFIFNTPDNLNGAVSRYAMDCDNASRLKNEIMVRHGNALAVPHQTTENVIFKDSIRDSQLEELLIFLRANAYWQSELTMVTLKLILARSTCFFAYTLEDELIGFARVLTDGCLVASVWDVAVAKKYRRKGVGMAMMANLFTYPSLQNIAQWILFTDTAKGFYQKFGFSTAGEMPDVNFHVSCGSRQGMTVNSISPYHGQDS